MALLLTALVACLSLLAHPSGKASATSSPLDVSASLRYGCATATTDSFVEVNLRPGQHTVDPDNPLVVQVGLAGPSSADADNVFPSGGPTLVSLDSGSTRVRLAGPVAADDHVFIRQVGQADIITLPLPPSCRHLNMTDYGLNDPDVTVSRPGCAGSQASLKVTLMNSNPIDEALQKIGINELDYTILLVRSDGLLAGSEPAGQLVAFEQPGASAVHVEQAAALPASYQVRVIAPDGGVTTVGNMRLSCEVVGHPGPSQSVTATPVRPSSSTPSTSSPAASSHPHTSSPAPSRTSHPSSASHSVRPSATPSSAAGSSGQGSPSSQSAVLGAADATSQAVVKPAPSKPSARPTIRITPTPNQTIADPPARLVSVFQMHGLFSAQALLIVLVFAASMAGLVGTTVVSARRR
ncbi:MAG: hypothetical protein ACR2N4_08125 [Jatrophihabitans sp.]